MKLEVGKWYETRGVITMSNPENLGIEKVKCVCINPVDTDQMICVDESGYVHNRYLDGRTHRIETRPYDITREVKETEDEA